MSSPSRFPHSLVLIFAMIVVAQLATYLLPRGHFVEEPRPDAGNAYAQADGSTSLRTQLATARQERGLTTAALASLFAVSPGTVEAWEAGPVPKAEAWRLGSHIEATVGPLLEAWIATGTAPSAAEIQAWKSAAPGRTRVLPGTYQVDDGAGTLPWYSALTSIPRGMGEAAEIIFFVFLIGGVIGVLRATGAIDALIGRALATFGGRPVLLIAGTTLLFAVGSSTIGMAEEYMPFIPLLVTLCLALRMDAIVAMGVVYLGAGVGYGCAALNPFTVLIAQDIAGLEPTSGMWLRVLLMLVATAVGVQHIVSYARRIQRDPARSLVHDIDYSSGYELPENVAMTPARLTVVLLFMATIVLFTWGIAFEDWYFIEMEATFLALALCAAILCRLSPNTVASKFCEGAADMTTTALLIGFARTIQVVLDDGQVIHTIVHMIAQALEGSSATVASLGMLVVQSCCNFFIPSGSGQAYVTMPIMAPLADVCGVTRQTAVLAYQIGDGFTNMIVPTNALLMGMLGLARIPYQRWLRFILPGLLKLYVVAAAAMVAATMLGYR